MTNAESAIYYRSLAVLYDRLAALDVREAKLKAFANEQSDIDSARKQVSAELEILTKTPALERARAQLASTSPASSASP